MHIPGHCGFPFWGSYVDAEARVAVPLLFMISGYYCKGEWSEMKRKVIHLLKIFAVSEVVYFIYHILTRGDEWAEWLRAAITMNAVWELLLRNSTRVFMVGFDIICVCIFGKCIYREVWFEKKSIYAYSGIDFFWNFFSFC